MESAAVILRTSEVGEAPSFEFTLDGHCNLIQDSLYSQWLQGTFCDLELDTLGGAIKAHSCLLAAFSPKIANALDVDSFGQQNGTTSSYLHVTFDHSVVKAIVEAIYSGFLTSAIAKLDELLSALQWLEMNDLVEVVKCVQDKAEKENLLTFSVALPEETEDEPMVTTVVAPQTRPRKRKSKRHMASISCTSNVSNPDSLNVVLSLVNDTPVLVDHNQKAQSNSPCQSLTDQQTRSLEEDECEESATTTSPMGLQSELPAPDVEERLKSPKVVTFNRSLYERNFPENFSLSGDASNSLTLQESNPSAVVSETTFEKDKRESGHHKQTKPKHGRPSKSSKEIENSDSKRKRRVSDRIRHKKSEDLSLSAQTTVENHLHTATSLEKEQEEKDASVRPVEKDDTVNVVDHTLVKEEPPEVEELDSYEEVELIKGEVQGFKCDKCSIIFSTLEEYETHAKDHPTFTCDNCCVTFYCQRLLVRHIRGTHLKKIHLKCTHCDFEAETDKDFAHHSAQVHQDPRPFKCLFDNCNFTTTRYRYLTHHFEKHEAFRVYTCVICKRTFENSHRFHSHKNSCYQSRKYLCDLCGMSFNHNMSMKNHRRAIHFGIRDYTCQVCDKSFSHNSNLRRHMLIHKNSFPYSCSICQKKYRHSNTLKQHMMSIHDLAPGVDLSREIVDTRSSESADQDLSNSFPAKPNSLPNQHLSNSFPAKPNSSANQHLSNSFPAKPNSLPNQHLSNSSPAKPNSSANQHLSDSSPAKPNSSADQHLSDSSPAKPNSSADQHLSNSSPAKPNSSADQHLSDSFPAKPNSSADQHLSDSFPAKPNSSADQHLSDSSPAKPNSSANQHLSDSFPAKPNSSANQHLSDSFPAKPNPSNEITRVPSMLPVMHSVPTHTEFPEKAFLMVAVTNAGSNQLIPLTLSPNSSPNVL